MMTNTRKEVHVFSQKSVTYIFDGSLESVFLELPAAKIVVITDANIEKAHGQRLAAFHTIVVPGGEENKQQSTVDEIIRQLLEMQADKQTVIVGIGGGVVSDMAGYVASIYKRGVKLISVPTSILGMVDAAVGGKNGVNVGKYKNMVGTVYQPDTILFDYSFLTSLPNEEWINGFAEIIKHACIKDAGMFAFLQSKTMADFQNDPTLIANLIEKNVGIKTGVVITDEFETGDRKLLNFGHTLGHAVETIHSLPHGNAISIGMVAAAAISEEINNFSSDEKQQLISLLKQYGLPVHISLQKDKIWQLLLMDKKRDNDSMSFILLDKPGQAVIKNIPLIQLKELLTEFV